MGRKKRVLFLCTGNSARSQMAEGLLRHMAGDRFEVHSAGTNPVGVNPLAIEAMREIEVDISHHTSKSLGQFLNDPFDFVITVCDRARESCPIFPGDAVHLHWSFDDPAAVEGSQKERLRAFRSVRDELAARLRLFVAAQPSK
ncbi:MAG: arsenate reductase ArsC [Acidobacteria bacterium]|nr:arsenate reductase ArsC [Acidobacteriota bacterium]